MSQSKRKPRWQRNPVTGAPNLTPRDIDIVAAVYKYRALSTRQIQYLFFSLKNRSGAQRRLDILFDHHLLDRRFLPTQIGAGRSPTLHILDQAGAELLRQQRQLDVKWYASYGDVSDRFLAHTYGLSQVMTHATIGCRQNPQLELLEWQSEREVKAEYNANRQRDRVTITVGSGNNQTRKPQAVQPDSIFAVKRDRLFRFFVELDRAEEDLKRFRYKIQAIIEYHRSKRYEQRFGGRSLRVLIVVDSNYGDGSKRLANLKAATEAAGGKDRFWLARLDELDHETFWTGRVWQKATRQGLYPLFE